MSINREKSKTVLFILAEMQHLYVHLDEPDLDVILSISTSKCYPRRWIKISGQIKLFPVHWRRVSCLWLELTAASMLSLETLPEVKHVEKKHGSTGPFCEQQHIWSIRVWRNRISAKHLSFNPNSICGMLWSGVTMQQRSTVCGLGRTTVKGNTMLWAGAYGIQEGVSKLGAPYSKQH